MHPSPHVPAPATSLPSDERGSPAPVPAGGTTDGRAHPVASAPAAVLDLCDLQVTVPAPGGPLRLLDIAQLTLMAGERAVVHGPSGTGKSTLLHVIAGLQTISAGTVTVAGQPLHDLGEAARDRVRARHIGLVFQTFNLLPALSAFDNVRLAQTIANSAGATCGGDEEARALLQAVGLGHRLDHRPGALSVGERQRVAIARALVHHPALLLADEPTGALDPQRALEVITLLENLAARSGAALLLVSHDPVLVERFPRRLDITTLNRALTAPSGSGHREVQV